MIPLAWCLIAWILLIGIFFIFSLITTLVYLRFGINGFMTYASSTLFLVITAYVLLVTLSYFATVDWSQSIDLAHLFSAWSPF